MISIPGSSASPRSAPVAEKSRALVETKKKRVLVSAGTPLLKIKVYLLSGGPIDELIRRGGAQSVRAEVGISHRDAGRRWQPDSDGVRAGTERGGPGEDAIVEVKQACDVGTNHAQLNLHCDGWTYSK